MVIGMDASAYGYNAAASKNAMEVKMPNGKIQRVKLISEYIRDRLDVTREAAKDIVTYMPAYIEFIEVWNYIVNHDKVVKQEFLRRLDINKKNTLVMPKDNSADDGEGSGFCKYRYHYIMHYDPELYKHNKKTQGKVRCGPFTESEIRSYF